MPPAFQLYIFDAKQTGVPLYLDFFLSLNRYRDIACFVEKKYYVDRFVTRILSFSKWHSFHEDFLKVKETIERVKLQYANLSHETPFILLQLEWGCPNGTKYPPWQPIPNRAILPNRARIYRQTDGQTDGRTDRQTDGRTG